LTQQLQALQREAGSTYTAQGQSFHAPRTLDELVALRAAHPKPRCWPVPPISACG
jgi:xanthine dehydrogenase small subunit